jgi:hypothetical protein
MAPSHTSTSATDGQSRTIALASSTVRLGRLRTSWNVLPEPQLIAPIFWM